MKSSILILTEGIPYRGSETFLHDEFIEIHRSYENVFYMPIKISGELTTNLPSNVKVIHACLGYDKSGSISKAILRNAPLVLKILFLEIYQSKHSFFILSKLKIFLRRIGRGILLSEIIEDEIKKMDKELVIYSTWMNDAALALSILRKKDKIDSFCFRVNGFDIFDERCEGNYMPFRVFNFSQVKNVIVLSNEGYSYLKKKNISPDKLVVNYCGIYPNPLNLLDKSDVFTILSCANLVELKRVDLIVKALKFCKSQIRWVHFGDGAEWNKIKSLVDLLPKNIIPELKGHKTQNEIQEFYKTKSVNLFLHVSRTEGLGMAIIEAQSYGIPQMCCGVGGVLDVVTQETGILLPVNIEPENLADEIESFIYSKWNKAEIRPTIQKVFEKKFDIRNNFKHLNSILNCE